MADVGVLNLQIQSNAQQASDGLNSLIGSLGRLKDATGKIGLSSVATGINKIKEAIDKIGTGDSLGKLNELAGILERIRGAAQGVNGIEIKFNTGSKGQNPVGVVHQMETAKEEAQDIAKNLAVSSANFRDMNQEAMAATSQISDLKQGVNEVDMSGLDTTQMKTEEGTGLFDAAKEGAAEAAKEAEHLEGELGKLGHLLFYDPAQDKFISEKEYLAQLEEEKRMLAEIAEERYNSSQAAASRELEYGFYKWADEKMPVAEEEKAAFLERAGITQEAYDTSSTLEEARAFDQVKESAEAVGQAIQESMEKTNAVTEVINQLDYLKAKLEEAKVAFNQLWENPDASQSDLAIGAMQVHKAESDLRAYEELQEKLQNVNPEIQQFAQRQLDAGVNAAKLTNQLFDLDGELKQKKGDLSNVSSEAGQAKQRFSELMFGAEGLNGAFSRMFPTISGLMKRFSQLAKYRMLRTVITQITKGFKEGLQNYYEYSNAVNGSFAPAMDSAASALATMKNSIGAAAAPLVQSLIPVLQTLVNWFITAINYVNQFIALLRGQASWSKAVPQSTKAFDSQTKAAKKTGKAMKDLLADWDELNIIQSKTSGSSPTSGTTIGTEYSKMFEEVATYSDVIKTLVDGINEKFGGVQGLVKRIGAILLGWKLSSAFTGWLGTLGSILAMGPLLELDFKITSILTDKFLNTGEDGWLIADVLKSVVGGVLASKILTPVLGGSIAYLGIPIMLSVNALSRVIATLGRADVDALSEEALKSHVTSALEVGGVAGYLAYTAGASAGKSLLGGTAVALLTFSALTDLQADVNAIENGEITENTIKAKALSSLEMSAGAALVAKLTVKDATIGQVAGFGAAVGASAILLSTSATVGIIATHEAMESGITEDVIYKDLESSMMAGLGSTLVIKMATPTSWKLAAAGGAGVAVVALGALIGIQATCEAVKNDSITEDTLIKDATSSLTMATGVSVIAGTIFAAGAGTALAAGGIAALVTFGALVGIQAILQAEKGKESIKWGDKVATQEQIQAFILQKGNGFSVDVPATIKLIKDTVTILPEERTKIEEDARKLDVHVNVIRMGLATLDTYKDLRNDLFGEDGNGGVIGALKQYAESQKTMIKTSFTLAPVYDDAGNQDTTKTTEFMKAGIKGWEEVETYMGKIGTRLGTALKEKAEGELKTFDDEAILIMMDELTSLQQAITNAQTSSSAVSDMLTSLTGIDKGNFDKSIEVWKEYKKQLEEETAGMMKEQLMSYRALEAFYRERGQEGDEEQAELFKGLADELEASWESRLKTTVDGMVAPGRELFKKAILEMINVGVTPEDLKSSFTLMSSEGTYMNDLIMRLFNGDKSAGNEANEYFTDFLDSTLKFVFKDNYDTIKNLIDAGALTYADLIPKEMLAGLADGLAEETGNPKIKEAWTEFLNGFFPEKSTKEEVEKAAEGASTGLVARMKELIEEGTDGSGNLKQEYWEELKLKITPFVEWNELNKEKMPDVGDGEEELHIWEANPGIKPPYGAKVPYGDATNGGITVVAEQDNAEQTNNVANGVARGMAITEGTLEDILAGIRALIAKPVATSGAPTARDGRWNAQAARRFGEVTGENS